MTRASWLRKFFDLAQDLLNVFESHLCDDGDPGCMVTPCDPSPGELLRGLSVFIACRPTHGDGFGRDGLLIASLTIVNTSPSPVEVTVQSYCCEAFMDGRPVFTANASDKTLGPYTIAPGELETAIAFESSRRSEDAVVDMRALHTEAVLKIAVRSPGRAGDAGGSFSVTFWAPYRSLP